MIQVRNKSEGEGQLEVKAKGVERERERERERKRERERGKGTNTGMVKDSHKRSIFVAFLAKEIKTLLLSMRDNSGGGGRNIAVCGCTYIYMYACKPYIHACTVKNFLILEMYN